MKQDFHSSLIYGYEKNIVCDASFSKETNFTEDFLKL